MTISRILGLVSLVIVAAAIVSVVTSWSDDDPGTTLSTSEAAGAAPASTSGSADASTPTTSAVATPAPAATEPGAAATSAAPTRTTRSPSLPPRSATLVLTGEIEPDEAVQRLARHYASGSAVARNFTPMFADVAATIDAAELAICHLEWPLSAASTTPAGSGPAELATALAASGWDGCSVASDRMDAVDPITVAATVQILASAGVQAAGAESRATMHDAGGIAVAHLAYTSNAPAGSASPLATQAVIADAGTARDAGAEFVIVSLHWGEEFEPEPTASQHEIAAALAASGEIDLVIGHHAHVVQPLELLQGTWVAYGLGNFLTSQSPGCCGVASEDGVVLQVEIADTSAGVAVTEIGYLATWVDRVHMKVHPVVDRLGDTGLPAWYRAVLRNSWERTDGTLLALGADQWGAGPLDELP